jgi:flagellar protein FlgJ
MIGLTTPVAARLAPAQAGENLREVAQGFEAMLLRQVLSAAGKSSFGGEELLGSSSDKTFTEMRDARFADLAASSGTLGLAAQIEAQLSRQIGAE